MFFSPGRPPKILNLHFSLVYIDKQSFIETDRSFRARIAPTLASGPGMFQAEERYLVSWFHH